jgi:hypothetical protein
MFSQRAQEKTVPAKPAPQEARGPEKISARRRASAARGRLREPTKRRRLTKPGGSPPDDAHGSRRLPPRAVPVHRSRQPILTDPRRFTLIIAALRIRPCHGWKRLPMTSSDNMNGMNST